MRSTRRSIYLFVAPLLLVACSYDVVEVQPSTITKKPTTTIEPGSDVRSGKSSTSPPCTKEILWYTKDSQVCAPASSRVTYRWQTIIERSDTTELMETCRSFFSTYEGQKLCDWMQKYINNIIAMKGPKDNCLTYWRNLLNNAARVAQTSKSATIGVAIEPFAAENSWVCHS